ncbi:calcium-responsive transcription factor-like protein [Labeo rohita]|uniref:Calcium-responsive transcription factor-like protein n=1 Tax=Labeo rohita TaxID=84645 RepID=A0A498M8J6_LABRO|nr:calcium-responsive transcription factor-like protein [Labeo rohita]
MFFFRKCTENNIEQTAVKFEVKVEEQGFPDAEDSDLECIDTEEITSSQETFLFIHQNAQQQELLKRYGDMVLLDATYRTTKYALPLFLLVVRTNVGYKPIAKFICENETTAAITEALNSGISIGNQNSSCLITRNNNTKLWNMYFQILRSIYAHSIVSKLGSDGQGKRWYRAYAPHGFSVVSRQAQSRDKSMEDKVELNAQQQELLKRYGDMVLLDATYRTTKYALPLFLLVVRTNVGYKPIAEFICENETTAAITKALNSGISIGNQNSSCLITHNNNTKLWNMYFQILRSIYAHSIMSKLGSDGQGKRWYRAYAPHGFSVAVTTNNGVEALNKSLKSFYLKFSTTGSLSSLLEMLVCEFVPEQLLSYGRLNFIYSSECKTYKPAVPAFLKEE